MIGDLVVHIHNFLKSVKLQETRKVLLQFANYKLVLSLEYKQPFFFFFLYSSFTNSRSSLGIRVW